MNNRLKRLQRFSAAQNSITRSLELRAARARYELDVLSHNLAEVSVSIERLGSGGFPTHGEAVRRLASMDGAKHAAESALMELNRRRMRAKLQQEILLKRISLLRSFDARREQENEIQETAIRNAAPDKNDAGE